MFSLDKQLCKIKEQVLSKMLICVKLLFINVKRLFYQVPQGMDNGMKLMYSCCSQVEELDKKNCFHDIVFVLYHKYALTHRKALLVLGERR
jgi:hypothetical protein